MSWRWISDEAELRRPDRQRRVAVVERSVCFQEIEVARFEVAFLRLRPGILICGARNAASAAPKSDFVENSRIL